MPCTCSPYQLHQVGCDCGFEENREIVRKSREKAALLGQPINHWTDEEVLNADLLR